MTYDSVAQEHSYKSTQLADHLGMYSMSWSSYRDLLIRSYKYQHILERIKRVKLRSSFTTSAKWTWHYPYIILHHWGSSTYTSMYSTFSQINVNLYVIQFYLKECLPQFVPINNFAINSIFWWRWLLITSWKSFVFFGYRRNQSLSLFENFPNFHFIS